MIDLDAETDTSGIPQPSGEYFKTGADDKDSGGSQ
jgi:hypothetical protein